MKTILHDSEYQTIVFDEQYRLMIATWKPATANMDEEAYRREILSYYEKIGQRPANGYLSDMRGFGFTITPDLQEWIGSLFQAQNFEPSEARQAAPPKSAVVMSADFFAHVSVEQAIDEIEGQGQGQGSSPTRYFVNIDEAMDWMQNE